MAHNCKEKVCVDCGKPYTPTSNVQKRCPDCMGKKKNTPPLPRAPKPKAPGVPGGEDSFVLTMLVAAGLVTQQKIDKAREIFRTLKA